MASPRPTYQQRLFDDEELVLQSHDQIIRWTDLSLRNRAQVVLGALGIAHQSDEAGNPVGWLPNSSCFARNIRYVFSGEEVANRLARHLAPPMPPAPPIIIRQITWEHILKSARGAMIGAIDLAARIEVAAPSLSYNADYVEFSEIPESVQGALQPWRDKTLCCDGQRIWVLGARQELSLESNEVVSFLGPSIIQRGSIHRISDICWHPKGNTEAISLMVEAKTRIQSAGELIRQINLYRQVAPSGTRFLVVAPASAWTDGLTDILREQGIATLTYMANG